MAACIVFVLSGAAPSREMLRERHQVRNGFIVAVVALGAIAVVEAVLLTLGHVQHLEDEVEPHPPAED